MENLLVVSDLNVHVAQGFELMFYLRRVQHIQCANLTHFVRTMSKIYVRNTEGEDRVQISFNYGYRDGEPQEFNAARSKTEPVGSTLLRIGQNIFKRFSSKKLRKKLQQEGKDVDSNVSVSIFTADGDVKLDENTRVSDAFIHGNIVKIDDQAFEVDVNAPSCLKIVLPDSLMVGFPIFPRLDLEFAKVEDCEFLWTKIKYEEELERDGSVKKGTKRNNNNNPKVIENKDIHRELSYTPSNSDMGFKLKLTCIPKLGERTGKELSTESKLEVTAGPGFCPFENRHLYTQKPTENGGLRVVSYNILADLYADQDYSRDVLFNYCPPYALAIDYRKHLFIKELKGYNSDVMCLQEVDTKIFTRDLTTSFSVLGFQGVFAEKAGEVKEGSAIFFRTSRFRLLEEYVKPLTEVLETDPVCQDIVKKTHAVPALKEILETRSTILHAVALEPVDQPGRLLMVVNTHLYFHPDAANIRIIQVIVAMRYLENVLKTYKKQKPCLIFCGDFNSTPDKAIYQFMTTKSVTEDHPDWKKGTDRYVPDMNFTQPFNLASGCGTPAYTNYTPGFNGHLDYIYYDTDSLEVTQVIPPPDHRDVELHSGLPSIVFPSDHVAQICDFKWK